VTRLECPPSPGNGTPGRTSDRGKDHQTECRHALWLDLRPLPTGAQDIAGARTSVSARWVSIGQIPLPRAHERRGGEGESPYEPPLGVHPQDGVAWVQNTRHGSPDLCVRPLGVHRPDTVARGHERRGGEGNRLAVARVDSNPYYGRHVCGWDVAPHRMGKRRMAPDSKLGLHCAFASFLSRP
jgi:hypothetical protein